MCCHYQGEKKQFCHCTCHSNCVWQNKYSLLGPNQWLTVRLPSVSLLGLHFCSDRLTNEQCLGTSCFRNWDYHREPMYKSPTESDHCSHCAYFSWLLSADLEGYTCLTGTVFHITNVSASSCSSRPSGCTDHFFYLYLVTYLDKVHFEIC